MDRLKSISKSGWHPSLSSSPSYDGASESRSSSAGGGGVTSRLTKNFKGLDQVVCSRAPLFCFVKLWLIDQAGWMGKGNDSPVDPRPVSTLRDPASFGPPPKRMPNAGISNDGQIPGPSSEGGRDKDEVKRPVPQNPHTANTAGLNTETLPLPPRRVDTFAGLDDEAGASRKRPPPIPPRLPPRGESALPAPREVVDMRTGGVNVAAVGRLSKAGISIPGFSMTPTTPPANPLIPNKPRSSASMSYLNNHSADSQGTPKEGTTFAQKKAAMATANSFYKNPSSVSFSDASAALKTGRNFQQRHGDQVASGYKKAQDMGLDKKIQDYSELYISRNDTAGAAVLKPPLPAHPPALPTKKPPSPGLPDRLPIASIVSIVSAIPSSPPGHGRKKPPPPLPKKKPVLPLPRTQSTVTAPSHHSPPVIPRGTRPSSSAVLRNNGLPSQFFPESPPDLDLCLSEAWFSKTPPKLPHSIECIEEKMHSSVNSWERLPSGRTRHTLVLSIRWTLNLSSTKIKVTWDASAPSATAKAEQKHFPPPSYPPQKKEWGERIVDWTSARMGQQVGNGECWTLAADCFSSLQAEDEAIAAEKIMTAQGTSFGLCIFSHYPSVQHQPIILSGFALKPGDILQFRSARWIRRDSIGRVVFEMRAGVPEDAAGCKDHTAVIETVQYNQVGIKLGVLQQNSNGLRSVTRGEYILGTDEMVEGGARVFRAVADGWAKFEAGW